MTFIESKARLKQALQSIEVFEGVLVDSTIKVKPTYDRINYTIESLGRAIVGDESVDGLIKKVLDLKDERERMEQELKNGLKRLLQKIDTCFRIYTLQFSQSINTSIVISSNTTLPSTTLPSTISSNTITNTTTNTISNPSNGYLTRAEYYKTLVETMQLKLRLLYINHQQSFKDNLFDQELIDIETEMKIGIESLQECIGTVDEQLMVYKGLGKEFDEMVLEHQQACLELQMLQRDIDRLK